MNIGVIFALLTILLFGSWAVPTKTLKLGSTAQAFWLTVGHLLVSVIVFIFVAQKITIVNSIGPFSAGVFWAIGITFGYVGIKNLGITKAVSIWIPVVILTSALWGLLFFKEAFSLSLIKFTLTLVSIALLIAAALIVVLSSKGEEKLGNIKLGILASVSIGIIHGSFFVPLKTSNLPIFVTFLPMTIGMVLTMIFISLFKKVRLNYDVVSVGRMMLAGIILGAGNYTALLTTQYLGVSQGYPLTQLGIIVNALWGTLVFKEITTLRGKMLIAVAIIVALLGAIILNFARM